MRSQASSRQQARACGEESMTDADGFSERHCSLIHDLVDFPAKTDDP